jgi:DNA-binding transcriptional LysR family regulator
MALNLGLLRAFHAVARAGSVSAAARAEFTSQPALSKAVRELERQLGVALMERSARGVVLTEAGAALNEYATTLFAIAKAAEDDMSNYRNLEAGTLRIGASTTVSTYVLPQLLGEFRQMHPRLNLRMQRGNTAEIEQLLCAYELDVALVEGPAHAEQLEMRPWREDELVCICSPRHPLAKLEQVWPDQLRDCSWLIREEGSGTREVMERILRPYGLPPADALVIGGMEALKQSVAANLGIGVVSRAAAADQLALGKLCAVPLAEVEMRRPFYWLQVKNRPASPAARLFERFIFGRKG